MPGNSLSLQGFPLGPVHPADAPGPSSVSLFLVPICICYAAQSRRNVQHDHSSRSGGGSATIVERQRTFCEDPMKILIIALLIAIVVSMAHAMFTMTSGPSDSKRMVQALTIRVALSLSLFAILMIGWYLGWLQPHQ